MTTTLTFLGAARTVTGSRHLLSVNDRRILIDAGMFQGQKELRELNWKPFPVPAATISDVLLTHAHADHCAYLPRLVKEGFKGRIWCTEGTRRLAEIVLRDAGHLQEVAAVDAKRGGWSKHQDPKPLFDTEDVVRTLPLLHAIPFETDIDLGQGVTARWTRAAHMLGAASIRVQTDDVSVVFSGDLGRHDHPLLKPRGIPKGADYVVMESTYGDREHPEVDIAHQELAQAITRTIERGGQVLIPAFAVDRTQIVLRSLVELFTQNRIPRVPVVVDSPMALRALDVYLDTELGELRDDITINDFIGVPELIETLDSTDSKRISRRTDPMIILASSGMAEGGRVLHHLKRLLPSKRNSVVMVGYQAVGTRGRNLIAGARNIKIMGEYIPVRAEILHDDEYSVHGDCSDLLDWLRDIAAQQRPRSVFLVHGEEDVQERFAERIGTDLDLDAVAPRYGEVVSLKSSESH